MQETVLGSSDSHSTVGVAGRYRSASWSTLFLVRGILAASFILVVFPSVDLSISRIFANGHGFPLSENPFLKAVRDVSRQGLIYLLLLMVLAIGLYAFLPRKFALCPPHKALFVLLSFLLGPLIAVQFLKNTIGRARPREIVEFGGTANFTPVWQYAAACRHSCSFPSGEAAVAAATLSLIVLAPLKWRLAATVVAVPILFFVSFNRVLFGAHFLSDVIVAWGLVLCLMMWLWRRISSQAAAIDNSVRQFGERFYARQAYDNSSWELDKANEKSGAHPPRRNGQ
ncbi:MULTISPECIES: phosphatase PAP2 family protein [unclassified Ochrobactrum]|jgi:membrane-associated PAP2 superfamily phosphatase|uniref:phosphatase PAP2 family protein n=1 Tax=unclassified Ochrobactrum TaxID=239106 RepID=UPI000DEFA719|nr:MULTISPECIES: phosphatase PAP2 family protein [unclassified Ochrobactrum]MBQ0710263.1 phosphatase PAP2 family protein [Ochrobactrum sp. AP1BH01-1]